MKCEFSKVIDGISKYINGELYPEMNDLQEFAARLMIGRIISNQEDIKNSFIDNGFIRTFGVVDCDGMVDVDGLIADVKREIQRQEKISFAIPMFGTFTFRPSDVDTLHRYIVGGVSTNENN
jgi:hypothetical protein